ncbi:MAG: GTP-binding protein [Candidatus Aenigmarchaeota archaeon]|nr:GTP-binding protein [Candidatus Aenigmarchaeota archaeon]
MTLIPNKENKNIEFKERLIANVHLKEEKRQHLATQMKYLLETGKGDAIYIIGVDDGGKTKGLTDLEFEETVNVLKTIAMENNADIVKVERFRENGTLIGKVLIQKSATNGVQNHVILGVAGHVHHGKSTLVAALMTGKPDLKGTHWLYLNVLPHEIERRLSADLHFALMGFKKNEPLHLKNPRDKKERAQVVEKADKVVSFVDAVGHEAWLRSTIRGLVGQDIDYGLLVIAADDGVTHITREHLGLLLAMSLPIIVCITKVDKMGEKRISEVEEQIDNLLKNIGKIPLAIKDENDLRVAIDKLEAVVPVLKTSAATLEGYGLLNKLLLMLPERKKDLDKPFLMFIDRVYDVTGVGTVVSGTIKQGRLQAGKELLLGPDATGNFRKIKATSIEMHYRRLSEADAGLVVGIAVRGVKNDEIERGMILCEEQLKPKAVKSFEAEILILHHPTRIANGYEPIIHLSTVSETAKVKLIDKTYMKAGETGNVEFVFKYKPAYLSVGEKFVFREGKTKGIGTVTKIVKYVS